MIAQDNGDIKERIDTNKDYIINIDEINNFIFDDKKGNNNLNELGNYLNGLSILQSNNDIIKRALMGYFMSKEWSDESKKIGNKIKANQPLEKRELSLLYLQMIDIYSRTGNKYQGNFDPNKPASGELLAFIKRQYNNQSYNPQTSKSDAQKFRDNQRKDKNGLYMNPVPSNIEIPQIPELSENNEDYVYNYCYRLIDWAEKNFANEVANIRYNARAEHYDQSKEDIPEYARYDILLFAYEKYCEAISNNNEKLIKQAGYKDSKDFERQMDELQKIGEEISQKFPNLEEALNTLQRFGEEVENNKKKYFKSDEEVEKAGKDSEEFNQFLETKAKEYKIDEIKASFEKDPETSEEAQKYCEGINKIIEYQEEVSQKTESYGDNIEKYQKYMQGNLEISQKYSSINEYMEIQKEYSKFIEEWENKIDFNKYEQYDKLREESGIGKDFHNMSVLGKIIMNPQDEHFPILGVKNAADEKQKKIDAFRNNLQNKSGTAYRLLTSLSGLANGFLSATVNVGTSLGYMILSLCGKDKAELDKRKKYRDDLDINLSSKQKESVYDPDTHSINLNRHNGITTVSSSIAQMLVLINGGGVMAKGLKGIGVAEGIASKAGLFGMSFITQVGQSYQEASNQGLNGGTAFSYSMLSATVQSALELVSPNEILLGKGSGITKELIRNLVKDGSKNSFMMLGKAFLKNVGMEIVEENIQEALQLSAGNLINMYADNKWGSELGADWSWQNFAQTAIITTLTTGITTGTSYMSQLTNMSDNDHRTLFTKVINNEGTYTAVMEMLNKAIHGEIKIPGTDITSLEKLRTAFLSVNDVGSNLHEIWRETQLNEDGTYKEKIETTQDETWIGQHDGQTKVDIANTTLENLPSDWQRENLEAAKVAESLVFDALVKGEEITPEMIEEMSREVHEEWRKRNPGEKSGAWDIPYDQLPESEKVKDRNQVILAIETTRQNLQNDYFNGKSHKFNVSESQAHANSSNMDKILSEINERNKSQKLEDLRNEICTQYETTTKEKIELTDEQLQSILDAHEQDGILGELTTGQLKQKVEILDKTITDPNVRRFLLEAGFCGSYANMLQAAQDFYQKNSDIINNSIDFVGKSINNAYKSSKRQNRKEYEIGEEVDIPRYDGSITHGAHIQSYNHRTGTYLVVRYQNGKYAEKYVSTEELDSINGSTTEISEISQTTKGYSVGQEINIIKKDGNIGKAKITEFNEIHGLYRTEWNENGKSKFYYFTKEELDNANPNHIGTEHVESHEIKESTNSLRKEMADIRRISDVIAIGDLHGEYIALKGNLEYAGLAKETNGHLQWTGGNKRVVFQGDILSDRGTDGLKIIKEIYQLRQQAQSQGGDINIIVGNHDDFMISYLTGRNGIHEDGINISIGDWAGGINNGQGRGILELARDFYTGKPPRLKNGLYDFKKILKNGHENILNNMRESHEGRIILEEICNMKPVLQIDDVLYCHTNPTQGMLQYLTNGNIQDNINMLNQKYQGYLRKALLGEGGQTISTREFNEISDLFLNTDNRDIGGIEKYAEVLKNSGINMISHGHSGGNGRRNGQYVYDNNKVDINGLKIVDTDFSYGKHGKTGGKEHSISVTEQNGGKIIMGDDAHYIEQKGTNSDYFEGKPHKFNVTESQARSNSLNMDRILNDMNEQNKPEMLQQLREEINKQYKESTGQELLLTDEQLLSILDAHEQDGILGELTTGQLKQKVKILSETIANPKARRFLLEAGFCGIESFHDSSVQDSLTDIKQLNYNPDYVHYKGDGIFWFDTNETESSNESKYQSAQESESSINKLIGHNDNISKEEKDALKEEETKIKTQGWFVEGHNIEDYEKDADIFIEQAKEMEIAHKQIFLDIAKEAGAKALFIGPPKSKERIVEKVRDEYLKQNRGLEAITDFTRSTVLFDSFSDFERGIRVLMDLKAKGTISEFTIKNRLTKTGCNDIMVNIKTKDGYVSEMQFHVPEVLIFRDGYLGAKTIELYTGLTEHRLTKDIFDLGDEKYTNNLKAYNRIIDRLNEGREKKLSLPKEQGQIVHDHDMYDIIRVLEKYENMDELEPDDSQLFTSKGVTLENIKNLIDDLKKMKENLCKEALDWHEQRAQ